MKRPVLWVLGFLICGIILGAYTRLPDSGNLHSFWITESGSAAFLLQSLGTVLGFFLCVILYRRYKYRPVFIFVLFLLLGMWRVGHSLHSYIVYPTYGQLSGVAQDIGVTGGGNQRVIVRMDSGLRVMAYIRPYQPWASLGQEITVTGELHPLTRSANPGGYNQFQHLRAQKVDATIRPDTILLGDTRLSPMVILRMARDRLAAVYDELLPPREAAVIRSMVLGDRADMDTDLAQQYRAMGIFHILSISGLHVAILMMAFNKALGLFLSERKASIIVLVVMVLYCLMTGASVATVRAVTMGGVLVFGKILNRKYDLLAAVAWACAALLVYEPLYLFNVGFQLSFSAVFGIGVLSAPVERFLAKLRMPKWGKFRSGLGVGIAAVSATYPVFAFHMYEIQLYSVVGNLIIAPTTTIILVMGLVVGLVGLVWMGGATILAGTVYFILRFYEIGSSFFAHLPNAMLLTGGGNLIVTGLGVVVLLTFAYAFNGFGAVFKKRLSFLFLAVMLLAVAVFMRHNPRGLHVTVLDTPGNYTVMRHRSDVLVAGAPRGGEDALLRYLDMHGVRRPSGLIITELPRTHDVNRLARLAERFDIFYISGDAAGASTLAQAALEEVAEILYESGIAMPQVLFLYNGDAYRTGRKISRVSSHATGEIGLHVAFGDTAINIGDATGNAHVHITEDLIITAANSFSTREYGAFRMHSNGRRIRLR